MEYLAWRPRTDPTHQRIRSALQPQLPPLCLVCYCRFNLPEAHQTLFMYFGDTTLGRFGRGRFKHCGVEAKIIEALPF